MTGIAQRYHKLLPGWSSNNKITIAVTQNSAIAQQPTKTMTNITKVISGYPFVSVLYHGPTLLVLRGDKFSTNIWAAVELAKQDGGYKMDGMSSYSYQTGDATSGYTVSEIVIVTMSK
jgi:hypothetical protein